MEVNQERQESFTSRGDVRTYVATGSGDITVETHDGPSVTVTLRLGAGAPASALDEVSIAFDDQRNELRVRTPISDGYDALASLKDLLKKRTWTSGRGHAVHVHLALPHGSSLDVRTASGTSEINGVMSDVKAATASGTVYVGADVVSLEVTTASGNVRAARVRDRLDCRSASGHVSCAQTATSTTIRTAAGRVDLGAIAAASSLSIRAVSGDVHIAVARGVGVDVYVTSVSGTVSSDIALDVGGDNADAHEMVIINVATVSGDVRIDRTDAVSDIANDISVGNG